MVNLYKQEIEKVAMEKIATRAWKKVFPKLSDKNYNRLLQSGVYNPDKELSGIERGTQAILNKYNASMVKKPNRAGAATVEILRDKYNRMGKPLGDKVVEQLKHTADKKGPYTINLSASQLYTRLGKPFNATGKSGGMIHVPNNFVNKMIEKNPDFKEAPYNLTPISRRDKDARKWSQAIAKRHEADEIRYGRINLEKGIGRAARYNSHVTPKVLMQESTHTAMMPRSIKNNAIRKIRDGSGEARDIKFTTGVPYGSSGVYDKKAAKRMENTAIDFNIWKARNGYN